MIKYQKIETIFARDMNGSKKLIEGQYVNPAVEYLKDNDWDWTEKIDGTNIGVVWDGHTVSFQGRTERSEIPKPLEEKLAELFSGTAAEEIFEQKFGETPAILFGEGYGNKIQKVGSKYITDGVGFILFDVLLPGYNKWLDRDAVNGIAKAFNIPAVPVLLRGSIDDAVKMVKSRPMSTIGTAPMEGLVGRPSVPVRDAKGDRLIAKVKVVDFE